MTKTVFELGDRLPTLDAGRVRLRWLTDADVPALFAIFGDPKVTRYWGFSALPDVAATAALLDDIHREFRAGILFQWGVEATSDQLVGTCTLARVPPGGGSPGALFDPGRATGRCRVRAAPVGVVGTQRTTGLLQNEQRGLMAVRSPPRLVLTPFSRAA